MKITNILTAVLILLFAFSLNQVEAQNEKKVKITIKTDKNGKKEVIKKEFDGESNELLHFLEEYGIDIDIDNTNKELLEIIIDKSEFENGGAERMGNHFIQKFGVDCEPKAFLGIHMNDENIEEGVEITKVVEGTAAEDAGLIEGDILMSIDGDKTNSYDSVSDKILSLEPGTEVKLAILREGKKKNIKATLGEKQNEFKTMWAPECGEKVFKFKNDEEENTWSEAPTRAFFGVSSGGVSPDGAPISYVTKSSSAEKIGVQDRDIITSFNGEEVKDFGDLSDLISDTSPGDAIEVTVLRDGQNVTLNGEMGKQKRSSCEDQVFKFDDMGGFEFDFDSEDFNEEAFEESMQDLKEKLQLRIEGLEDMEFDFDFDADNTSRSMTVIVLVEDLSQEECNKVNENAEHKISPSNTLELEDVSFYPNPNDGIFNLEFETIQEGDMTLNIYDQNGKTVYKEMLAEFEGDYRNRIDISNRANGAYYLQIIQNGQTFNKKILKQ